MSDKTDVDAEIAKLKSIKAQKDRALAEAATNKANAEQAKEQEWRDRMAYIRSAVLPAMRTVVARIRDELGIHLSEEAKRNRSETDDISYYYRRTAPAGRTIAVPDLSHSWELRVGPSAKDGEVTISIAKDRDAHPQKVVTVGTLKVGDDATDLAAKAVLDFVRPMVH